MSKKLAAQALDALLSSQSTTSKKNSSTTVLKKTTKKGKVQKDRLPATKTGLKKIKHELRYGHSVRRTQEEKESKENPLERLKSQQEKEQAIVERNLNYYKVTNRVSKKELELRKKIKLLRERSKGEPGSRKTVTEQDESDGEDF
ncbi:hypothetical protein BGZ75_004530 [Mortierella antarctica]|nr:hypothetical protein BGZ67_007559 [Mortierella alpina]KAF9983912.1 hypothetical protein BGZ75_004530 [Mortierella antarctica]